MEQHPLSAAFPDATALVAGPWRGMSMERGQVVDISPSERHPGFVNYSVTDIRGGFRDDSRRPVRADMVETFLKHMPMLAFAALEWAEGTAPLPEPDVTERDAGGERVYFIRAGAFVKIGKESGPVIGARLRDLQTGCPWPMHLVAVLPGGLERERELHLRFAHLRVRNNGEWFHERGALAQFIAQLEPVQ